MKDVRLWRSFTFQQDDDPKHDRQLIALYQSTFISYTGLFKDYPN